MTEIVSSLSDTRRYRATTLQNGLNVVLVEDAESQQCAASMTVAMGHFHDPMDCQGLAHLLEHLLFLGSKNFPEANHLQDFLQHHGGQVNAWTGTEHSSFHFECMPAGFSEGVAQFAAMLATPLFDTDWIDKEIQAIDAEFKLKIKDDLRRLYQVHKESCNPAHPFSKFSVGRGRIFRQFELPQLASMLHHQHEKHYVAKNMRFCLVGPQSLDTLEQLATQHFSALSAVEPPQTLSMPSLYRQQDLAVRLLIRPISTTKRLIITFALPGLQEFDDVKPLSYISHLLGDESPGSLFCYLKNQGWATSLSAGGGVSGSNFKDFNVNLQLTDKGLQHQTDILEALFAAIARISAEGIEAWRFEEKRRLLQLAFDFQEKSKAADLAGQISVNLHHYPVEQVLSGEYWLGEFDKDCIAAVLGWMTPDNMRLKLIENDVDTDREADYYGTPYRVESLESELLDTLRNIAPGSALKLPNPNAFIPTRLNTQSCDPSLDQPRRLHVQPGQVIWFGQDNQFRQPKGDIFLSMDCPVVESGIEVAAHKRLLVAQLQESLNQQFYAASIAGLHQHIYAHQGGIGLHTHGFSDNQMALMSQLVEGIFATEPTAEQLEITKKRQLQSLRNSLLNKPVNRLFSQLSILMQPLSHEPSDLVQAIEKTDISALQSSRRELLEKVHLEGFIYGDWPQDAAQDFCNDIQRIIARHSRPSSPVSRDIIDLCSSEPVICRSDSPHQDACVVCYLQSPSVDTQCVALTILAEQLIAAPFFNMMRTQKQLGYLVGTGYAPFNRHPGFAFYIQSPRASAQELLDEIYQFQVDFNHALANYPEEQWQSLRLSVVRQLQENDANFSMKVQRLWLAIGNADEHFNQKQALIECLSQVTFEQLRLFYQQIVDRIGFGEAILYSAPAEQTLGIAGAIEIDELHPYKQSAKRVI